MRQDLSSSSQKAESLSACKSLRKTDSLETQSGSKILMNAQPRPLCGAILLVALLVISAAFAADALTPTRTALVQGMSAEEIVARMRQSNSLRAASLSAYDGKRSYSLSYRGFPSDRDAQEEVIAHYTAPAGKSFDVISGRGSKMIQTKVFAKLLESEREAAHEENQRQTALTPENYTFTLVGSRPSPNGGCYLVGVQPRREDKFLYRGKICVNAADFAVESIDAEPAKSPSFWIKKTQIEHRYEKIGQFWLPASNHTVTSMRMGGTATLDIMYSEYALR